MSNPQSRERLVAIITGVISIGIGILYLVLITVLDSRGPMVPPPPEAFGEVEVHVDSSFEEARLLVLEQFQETALMTLSFDSDRSASGLLLVCHHLPSLGLAESML